MHGNKTAFGNDDFPPQIIEPGIDVGEPATNDEIDHPMHYTQHPAGIECIDVVEHFNHNRGTAIAYIWRAGLKGDAVTDLKKARWYIDREIRRISTAAKVG